jgi:hypothetical protein
MNVPNPRSPDPLGLSEDHPEQRQRVEVGRLIGVVLHREQVVPEPVRQPRRLEYAERVTGVRDQEIPELHVVTIPLQLALAGGSVRPQRKSSFVPEQPPRSSDPIRTLVERWSGPLIVLLQRAVRRPDIAYDVAAEAFCRARQEYQRGETPPIAADLADDSAGHGVAWLIAITAAVLGEAATTGVVPSLARRRVGGAEVRRLTRANQSELIALTEQVIVFPDAARAAAAALARDAPPPSLIAQLRVSDLIDAESIGEEVHERLGD